MKQQAETNGKSHKNVVKKTCFYSAYQIEPVCVQSGTCQIRINFIFIKITVGSETFVGMQSLFMKTQTVSPADINHVFQIHPGVVHVLAQTDFQVLTFASQS